MVVSEGDGYIDVVVALSAPRAQRVGELRDLGAARPRRTSPATSPAVSGTLSFAPGETTKTVRIDLEHSASCRGTLEHFSCKLSVPTNATIAKASAMIRSSTTTRRSAVGEQPELFVRDVVVDEKAGTATFDLVLGKATDGGLQRGRDGDRHGGRRGHGRGGLHRRPAAASDFAAGQTVKTRDGEHPRRRHSRGRRVLSSGAGSAVRPGRRTRWRWPTAWARR